MLATACAHAPQELVDARTEYVNALPTADLTAARIALEAATAEYEMNGDSERTRGLAYIARRKVEIANAYARVKSDQQVLAGLAAEAAKARERLTREIEAQASALPPVPERPAPPLVEVAPTGLDALDFAKSRDDAAGKVITIPASLLFAAGQAALTDEAKQRLDQVAAVLKARSERISVGVHTDNLGPRAQNAALSMKRAKAVRAYLVERGVEAARIEAHGFADTKPVHDNSTPENRDENRRLEIVLRAEPVSWRR